MLDSRSRRSYMHLVALLNLEYPYVVDAGDPWVLTSSRPEARAIGRVEAQSRIRLWDGAVGGVVTTDAQARALASIFPSSLLIRPNGFSDNDFPLWDSLSRGRVARFSASPRALWGHLLR